MSSYSFNSEPWVVNQRTEKYRPESKSSKTSKFTNLASGSNTNLKSKLTPQEQEKAQIEKQKELKQQEMMKTQLEAFKKSKIKQTPYDIRPAAPPRIEVDLQYFLTDQHDSQRSESTLDTQTDTFLSKPPSPKYIPKKTGIDAETQIWDGDLFNFNREVQPILNVIVSKTIEQALLEVEEEAEMESISIFKMQNSERKHEERADWEQEIRAEIERINHKSIELEKARVIHNKKLNLIHKIQNLQLAKNYLSKLAPNTLIRLQEANLHPDTFPHQLHYNYLSWLIDHTQHYVQAKLERDHLFDSIYTVAQKNIIGSRKNLITSYKDRAVKKQIKNINNTSNSRLVRFIYLNPLYGPYSEFNSRLQFYISNEPYIQSETDILLTTDAKPKSPKDLNFSKSNSKFEEVRAPESIEPVMLEKSKYKTILIDDIRKISLGVANNPYFETVKDRRKYSFHAVLYSESGVLIEAVDVNSSSSFKGIKICTNCRDLTQRTSDDEKLVIDLKSIPQEVNHIIFYIKTLRNTEEFPYARYNIQDYETSQPIDVGNMKGDFAEEDEEGIIPPLFLAYRIYKQEANPRGLKVTLTSGYAEVIMPSHTSHWLLEIYKMPIKMRVEKFTTIIQSIISDGFEYLQNLTEKLIKYREFKLREQIDYRKKIEENESKNKNKKNKKKSTEIKLQEPVPPAEYQELVMWYPTRTFGPIMLKELDNLSIEEVYEKVRQGVDNELLLRFVEGLLLKIRNHPLIKSAHILKAKTLQELIIAEKPAPRMNAASHKSKSKKSNSSSSSSSDND